MSLKPRDWRFILDALAEPYTDALVAARTRSLLDFHSQCTTDPRLASATLELTRRSFWAHWALLVWTHDEKAALWRVKPASPLECYRAICDFLDERDPDTGHWAHPKVFVKKSRQLMMSWICTARLDWIALHNAYSYCPIVSKDADDAAAQVRRVDTIHRNYPRWFRQAMGLGLPAPVKGVMRYPNESILESQAQAGGNALRSLVPTAVLFDEGCFQSKFASNYGAAIGTLDARSQLIAASTVGVSLFMDLYNDKDAGNVGGREITFHESEGLSIARNKNNQLDTIAMHYTADPARRTAAWIAATKPGYLMHDWRREQEMDEFSRGGRPIFPMLRRDIHVTEGRIHVVSLDRAGEKWGLIIEGYNGDRPIPVTLMRGVDHGTSGFCGTLWVAVDPDLDWFVFRERKKTGWAAPGNAMNIAEMSWRVELPGYERYRVDVIDAMMDRNDQRGKVEEIYREYKDGRGLRPFRRTEAVVKGQGSRQRGLDMLQCMLLSTLAARAPDHPWWDEAGYTRTHREGFLKYSSLYLGRDVAEEFFAELDKARWDEPTNPDPEANRPETSLDMADDLIDVGRYLITGASGCGLLRQNEAVRMAS